MTKEIIRTSVAIISYPGCMLSAVHGLKEMLLLSNDLCQQNNIAKSFHVKILEYNQLAQDKSFSIIIIPPNIADDFYLNPTQPLINWMIKQHQSGSIICSACAGAFILGAANLLHNRTVTTHWQLADTFQNQFKNSTLKIDKILINDGDIITAGGLMSWLDLGFELVTQYHNASIMRQLGKLLVIDTGKRQQQYYKSFSAKLDHGDSVILNAQHYIQSHFSTALTVSDIAQRMHMSERTFLRHFVKASGLKPTQYIQHIRIRKAQQLLEETQQTIQTIALNVGYEDISAFRKIFIKIVGLTPIAFLKKFSS